MDYPVKAADLYLKACDISEVRIRANMVQNVSSLGK